MLAETLTTHLTTLHRSSYDGTEKAEYQLEGYDLYSMVLAPGGLLFCSICVVDVVDANRDEIIALDAQTLQLRFGLGLLDDVSQLTVGGDELYVCDTDNHRLQVFSLTGEHRRSILGEWRLPVGLCFAKDRLYLVEAEDDAEDGDTMVPVQGRRILVLSLQGDILQVVTHPTGPSARFRSICCLDDKLLAIYDYYEERDGTHFNEYGMLALQGL